MKAFSNLLKPSNVVFVLLSGFAAALIIISAFSLPESVEHLNGEVTDCVSARRFTIKRGSPYWDCKVMLDGASKPIMALSTDDFTGKTVLVRVSKQTAINQTNYFIVVESNQNK